VANARPTAGSSAVPPFASTFALPPAVFGKVKSCDKWSASWPAIAPPALIRAGFRGLLNAEDGIDVVAEAAGRSQAVALAGEHLPDVALIDIQMPVLDGIQATRQIAGDPRLAGVHVVILTNYGLDEYVYTALRAGRVDSSSKRVAGDHAETDK
jgi:DNA-binding NarL/FixJ family response regulator